MTFWKCHVTQDFQGFTLRYCKDHSNTVARLKTVFQSALQFLRVDLIQTVVHNA